MQGEEFGHVQWDDKKAKGVVEGFSIVLQQGLSSADVNLIKLSAEEIGGDALQNCYWCKVLDKRALVRQSGFEERMPIDGIVRMLKAAISGEDEHVRMNVWLGEDEQQTLNLRIAQVTKYYGDVNHDIVLDEVVPDQPETLAGARFVELERQCACAEKDIRILEMEKEIAELRKVVADLMIEQGKDKRRIAEMQEMIGTDAGEEKKEGDGSSSEFLVLGKLVWKQTWTRHSDCVTFVSMSVDGCVAVSGRKLRQINSSVGCGEGRVFKCHGGGAFIFCHVCVADQR